MNSLSIIVLAFIAEAVWETLKMVWEDGKFSIDKIGALIVGLVVAFATGADVIAISGIALKIPYVGIFLTGVLIARGSNFMHDLFSSVNNIKENTKDVGKDA